nr:hypothetical protein [Tanacetum cinerariifolium]
MDISSSNSSSDNVSSCSKACFKAYSQLQTQYDTLTKKFRKSQCDVISYQAGLESVEARLLVYKQNESVLEENIKLLNIEVQLRDIALATLRQKLDTTEKERDDLNMKLEKFQTSSKRLTNLLASQTSEKAGIGYNSQVFTKAMFGCDSFESDSDSWPPKSVPNGGPTKPEPDLSSRPSAPIIEEWVSDSEEDSKTTSPQIAHSSIQSTKQVTPPRHSIQPVEAPIPVATPKPTTPKTNRSGKQKNRKTCFVCRSVDHLIKDCHFHAKPKPQPTPRNYAHRGHTKQNASFPQKHLQMHMVPAAVFTQTKPVSVTAVRPVSADVPKIMKSRPKYAHTLATQSKSTIRRHKTRSHFSKTSNSSSRVTAAKAQRFTAAKGKQAEVNAASVYGYYCRSQCLLQLIINVVERINVVNRYVPEYTGVSQSDDIFDNCITQGWSYKWIVIIDWCDLKCISENIFVKIEPLLIQLTAVYPSS